MNIWKRIIAFLAALFISAAVFFSPLAVSAGAAEKDVKFDETDVMEDLQSMEDFSLAKYPFYETAEPEMRIIDFVEYCYDYRANMRDNYGLYLYVYNPNAQNVVTNSTKNKVQIAVAYDSDPITEKSNALTYEKFDLRFCSVSEGAGINKLFYKFKVVDHESADGKMIAERVNSMDRRYDISGIELLTEGKPNATEYGIATSYHFKGFAEGYGEGGAGTTLTRDTLETISLDLHSTTYRFPWINQNGARHQNQLDSVYFAVPKEYNENYGELYRVKCCWDERQTTPVIVTNKKEVYERIAGWVGQKESLSGNLALYYKLTSAFPGTSSALTAQWGVGPDYHKLGDPSEYGYCAEVFTVHVNNDTPFGYLFESNDSNVKDTDITPEQMKDWIYSHESADYLFTDSVDEGRTRGYQEHTFTADEPFDMLTFNQSASGWDKFCVGWQEFWTGGSWDFGPEQQDPVEPIRLVKDSDFTGTDAADADKLYVHNEDFDKFESFYKENKATKNVFLLRFAVTDYFSDMATVAEPGDWYNPFTWQNGKRDETSTYIARETVFLDFDIIELTFLRDTTETIIPVVASPIDVVGGISAPIEKDSIGWGKFILAILALILIFIFLWPILPLIIKAVVWVVTLPFKLIAVIIKTLKKPKGKRRNGKE